jgi:Anti-sigma factor NepR
MAAKPPPDDETVTSSGADDTLGLRSIADSFTNTQLAAEIGRCLQSQYQDSLKEALPDELAALVRQLQEREDETGSSRRR